MDRDNKIVLKITEISGDPSEIQNNYRKYDWKSSIILFRIVQLIIFRAAKSSFISLPFFTSFWDHPTLLKRCSYFVMHKKKRRTHVYNTVNFKNVSSLTGSSLTPVPFSHPSSHLLTHHHHYLIHYTPPAVFRQTEFQLLREIETKEWNPCTSSSAEPLHCYVLKAAVEGSTTRKIRTFHS